MATPYEQLMKLKKKPQKPLRNLVVKTRPKRALMLLQLAKLAEELRGPEDPEAEPTSGFFSDVVGRVGFGQGLAMGYGDELEAYARSAFTDETYEEALKDVREKIATARRERPLQKRQ